MDRVKSQAAVVSQLLFDPKTADAYKNVLVLTGQIIKEVALLSWLLICSVFVFGAWFSNTAISTGQNARTWWQAQQAGEETNDGNQAAAATGKALLDVSQNGAYFLLDKAREQLGLEKIERPAKAEEPKPAKAAAKTVAKTPPAPATVTINKVNAVAKETKSADTKTAAEKSSSDAKGSTPAAEKS
ncbi:hypothetical protein IQ260_02605 [Leptolyngbya cf. ectocarpi LEGE 11479]|uniref:Uncharacterized protein n=1 Tax=Leptolyngbya cf. ectocarpi LEGE 11479 TaxID=1828722 RepID=A0A928X087_LEPEC|nr:hypothetical protein [Leptolyngbya ectocarpi]MBE9065540.1 hypothetical protein [Leptolyngbya cf. ectocarpi LEGE 11479]